MKRREFIGLVGSTVAACPFAASAQQLRKVYRIALVHPTNSIIDMGQNSPIRSYRTFFDELRGLGYVEGQNLIVERFSGEGRRDRYAELAINVVRLKPDLIFAISAIMAARVKIATNTIAIVTVTTDPVVVGLVTSISHPGGNLTGVVVDPGLEIWGKRLELLQEIVPGLSKVGFLATRLNWELPQGQGVAIRQAAQRLRLTVSGSALDEPGREADYRRAFAGMSHDRVGALVVSDEPENFTNRKVIVELAESAGLPAIYPWRENIELGGLMAYAFDDVELFRHAAHQVDQILKGANPGDIPFYQSAKFELVINLKGAKALGLTVPPSLLARADQVIE